MPGQPDGLALLLLLPLLAAAMRQPGRVAAMPVSSAKAQPATG